MKHFFYLFALILFISSCKNVTGDQEKQLFDDVMKLHDEIMPVSTKLQGLQSSLKAILEKPDSIAGGLTQDDIIQASMHAEKAYNDMMDWMRDFKIPENMNPQDKITYLTAEKNKLVKMKEESLSALHEAEAILKIKK